MLNGLVSRFRGLTNNLARIVEEISPAPLIAVIILLGLSARLCAATFGSNHDFRSYLVVSSIVEKGGNVYAETTQYNYGPVWFLILGLARAGANLFPDSGLAFRFIIPSILSLVDIGIFAVIWRTYGKIPACVFFLNPISIVITGYHNQFDNLAILLGMLAVQIYTWRTGLGLSANKWLGLTLLGLSLMTKHVLFAFPLWLAVKQKGLLNKLTALTVPVAIFFAGFVPFWSEGSIGIVKNVFLYRSFDNGIFWQNLTPNVVKYYLASFASQFLPDSANAASAIKLVFLVLGLTVCAFVFIKKDLMDSLLLYTCVLLVLTPALASQYLAIAAPFAAVNAGNPFFFLYLLAAGVHLSIYELGLSWLHAIVADPLITYPVMIELLVLGLCGQLLAEKARAWVNSGLSPWPRLLAIAAAAIVVAVFINLWEQATARARFVVDEPEAMTPTGVEFGSDVRLLGYSDFDSDFRPGGYLRLNLYWEALRPLPVDYKVSIQLLDPGMQRLSGVDTHLGFAGILPYLSSQWYPGEIIRQHYSLQLPDTEAPVPLRVAVIVYTDPSKPLGISYSEVAVVGSAAAITGVSTASDLRQAELRGGTSIGIQAGAQLVIEKTSLGQTHIVRKPLTKLVVGLEWYALTHPDRDYHLFLHLLTGSGNLIAQWDGGPVVEFPTDTWPPGSRWCRTYDLDLPDNILPGDYSLVAGVYDIGTLGRLPLNGPPELLWPDDRFLLSSIRVVEDSNGATMVEKPDPGVTPCRPD